MSMPDYCSRYHRIVSFLKHTRQSGKPQFTSDKPTRFAGCLLLIALYLHPAISHAQKTGPSLGALADPQLVDEWDTTIFPDGTGLPDGSGTVDEGAALYQLQCLSCHGPNGQGALAEELAGGEGTLTDRYPDKTIGLYWPYATTIFDVIRRSMPLHSPGSLSDSETYSLTAYLLSINGIIDNDVTINADSLPLVTMPNSNGFRSIEVDYKQPDATR